MGAAKTAAVFKSPAIAPDNAVNDIIVVVNAAAYYNAAGTQYIKVEVHDASDNVLATFGGSAGAGNLDGTLTQHTSADAVEIPTTSDYMKSFAIPASVFPSSDNMYLVFSCDSTNPTSQNRLLIGDVLITQATVSSLTQLGTPTNLLAPSTNYFGFALSWNPVTDATNGYTVTLSPAEGNSGVTVNGTTATMTGLTEGGTYDVSVVAKGDGTGTDDSEAAELRGVTTLTAPPVSQPDLMSTVSASALTVSWPAQNDAAFSVLAWTNKPVNVASQDFAGYAANGTVPEGWVFENSRNHYPNENAPVDFRADGNWIASPEFGGPVESVSFHVAAAGTVTNSHFFVYGTTGTTDRDDWILLSEVTDPETGKLVSEQKTISVSPSAGIKRIIFAYQKDQGNVRIGTFSVTGTGVGKQPVYLTGYGPDPTDVNTTSVTFANPVVGETYYVEVTATGRSGRTESKTISVPIPAQRRGSVIAVK